jgi:uncharacterized protein
MDKTELEQLNQAISEAKFLEATAEKILDEETGQEIKVFVVSDETVDREGEIISIDGWNLDNFKRNPVMLWSHNPFEAPIGKWENIRFRTVNGKKKLTMEPNFHKKSDMSKLISDLVELGYPPQTTSVGFRPYERNGNKYTKQELLEVSFVNIPANPEATQLALSRGYAEAVVSKLFTPASEPKIEDTALSDLKSEVEQLKTEIKNLGVALEKANKPVSESGKPDNGRSESRSKVRRLLQLSNKALSEALRLEKQHGNY